MAVLTVVLTATTITLLLTPDAGPTIVLAAHTGVGETVYQNLGKSLTSGVFGPETTFSEMPFDVDARQVSSLGDRLVNEFGAFTSPGWIFTVGYSRCDDSYPLDNDVRRRVYRAIERSPGSYSVALADSTQIPRSTIRYHVRVLRNEGLIVTEKIRGKQRHFPREVDDVELTAALRDTPSATVLGAIGRLEPVTVSRLAAELDRAPSTISYHLGELTDAGLVEQRRDGNTVLNRLAAQTRTGLFQGPKAT